MWTAWCVVGWVWERAWVWGWAGEWLGRAAGLAGLGLLCAWGGWALGRSARRWLDRGRWRLWDVAFLARRLRLAASAPARLDALGRIDDCLRTSEPSETRALEELAWSTDFPDALIGSLFDCLVEGGREVAEPLLGLLRSPYFDVFWSVGGRMSVAAREELFAEASLARLRSFFLRSEDPVAQKAFLRLFRLASKDLWWLKWRCEEGVYAYLASDTHQTHKYVMNVGGLVQENDGPDVPLIRGQFDGLQGLLRDADFLAKARASVGDGGEAWALEETCDAYAELAYPGEVRADDDYKDFRADFGVQFLLRPLLPRLARRWDELPDSVKGRLSGLRVFLFDGEGPEEAAEVVERCVVPLLLDAHRIPLGCLRWLVQTLLHDPDEQPWWGYMAVKIFGGQQLFDFSTGVGPGLRDSVWRALKTALGREGLGPDKAWFLLGCVWDPAKVQDPELRLAIVETWWRLPLSTASRDVARWVLWRLLETPGVEAAAGGWLVGRGAFAMAERLLRLNGPAQPSAGDSDDDDDDATDNYSHALVHLFGLLHKLLQPSAAAPPGPALGPREETERLMAWREQGLGPALRRTLLQAPPPHTFDLRPDARELLDLADGLLHQQPGIPATSKLPTEIRFPDWEW